MAKSKRSKIVSLTKTKKARKELKSSLIETIRENVDNSDYVYVFSFENMRTSRFKDLRNEWPSAKFCLGKNKVMQVALGVDEESAYRPELDKLAMDVSGNVGLLFTNKAPEEVAAKFAEFETPDFARAGFIPQETIVVSAGNLEQFPHTMVDQFRRLGMSVRLNRGVVVLPNDFTLCTADVPITPEQGRLLELFGYQLATFRVHLVSMWKQGEYTSLALEGSVARLASAAGNAAPPTKRTKKTSYGRTAVVQGPLSDGSESSGESDYDMEPLDEDE